MLFLGYICLVFFSFNTKTLLHFLTHFLLSKCFFVIRNLPEKVGPSYRALTKARRWVLVSENVNYSLVEDSQNLMQSFFELTTKQLAEIKMCWLFRVVVAFFCNTYQVSYFWSSVDNLSSRRNIWRVVDLWLLVKRNIKCFPCFPDHICSTYRSQVNILWILYILNSTCCHCHSASNYGSCYPDDKDIGKSFHSSVEDESEP